MKLGRLDVERIAEAVVDSIAMGPELASKRNDLAYNTLLKYRRMLDTNDELRAAVAAKLAPINKSRERERLDWVHERGAFLREALIKLRELVKKATEPEHIFLVAGAVKIVGELDIAHIALFDMFEAESSVHILSESRTQVDAFTTRTQGRDTGEGDEADSAD